MRIFEYESPSHAFSLIIRVPNRYDEDTQLGYWGECRRTERQPDLGIALVDLTFFYTSLPAAPLAAPLALVSTQRRQYRILSTAGADAVPLSMERVKKLEDIGFEWSAVPASHKSWDGRYAELVAFVVSVPAFIPRV